MVICPCGRALLPYDRILARHGELPAIWRWLCPIECTTRQVIGEPARALLLASLETWPRAGTTVATHISMPHDVYVGRAGHGQDGFFGNPIRPDQACPICKKRHRRDAELLTCYGRDLRRRLAAEHGFRPRFYGLRGLRLACFCRRRGDEPCHAGVIADVLNATCRPRAGLETALAETEPQGEDSPLDLFG
jgi:hypothetical protein